MNVRAGQKVRSRSLRHSLCKRGGRKGRGCAALCIQCDCCDALRILPLCLIKNRTLRRKRQKRHVVGALRAARSRSRAAKPKCMQGRIPRQATTLVPFLPGSGRHGSGEETQLWQSSTDTQYMQSSLCRNKSPLVTGLKCRAGFWLSEFCVLLLRV